MWVFLSLAFHARSRWQRTGAVGNVAFRSAQAKGSSVEVCQWFCLFAEVANETVVEVGKVQKLFSAGQSWPRHGSLKDLAEAGLAGQ